MFKDNRQPEHIGKVNGVWLRLVLEVRYASGYTGRPFQR
jgi:hypothetical protein